MFLIVVEHHVPRNRPGNRNLVAKVRVADRKTPKAQPPTQKTRRFLPLPSASVTLIHLREGERVKANRKGRRN